MGGRDKKAKGFSRLQIWRLGEYGTFLAVIPGTVLSVLTGQFIFALLPMTLSLWVNLVRRSFGDCTNDRVLLDQGQDALHRSEFVLASLKRDRAAFLLSNAGNLTTRDFPQLMRVIDDRVHCIEENRGVLEAYLQESSQAILQDLAELQDLHSRQAFQLEQLSRRSSAEFLMQSESSLQTVQELCEDLSTRICKLQSRLETLAQEPLLKDVVSYSDRDLISSFDQKLNEMHQALSEQLNVWEEVTREQRYKFQRLCERLNRIKASLEHWKTMDDLDSWMQPISSQYFDLDALETKVAYELDRIKHQLEDLQALCVPIHSTDWLEPVLNEAIADAFQRIHSLSLYCPEQSYEFVEEQVTAVSTPLLEHLSECDQKVVELTQSWSDDAIKVQLKSMDARLQALFHRLDIILEVHEDSDLDLNEFHIQLAVIRVKLEELNMTVLTALKQIPYRVESSIRQKF